MDNANTHSTGKETGINVVKQIAPVILRHALLMGMQLQKAGIMET